MCCRDLCPSVGEESTEKEIVRTCVYSMKDAVMYDITVYMYM